MTSGPSEEPPIPHKTTRECDANLFAISSIWGSSCCDDSGRSTQLRRIAASAAAFEPHVLASLLAIRGCASRNLR